MNLLIQLVDENRLEIILSDGPAPSDQHRGIPKQALNTKRACLMRTQERHEGHHSVWYDLFAFRDPVIGRYRKDTRSAEPYME
jgi:hypothetical protein